MQQTTKIPLKAAQVLQLPFSVIFQVFFSSYIFKANVMVQVATQRAANPVSNIMIQNSIHYVS